MMTPAKSLGFLRWAGALLCFGVLVLPTKAMSENAAQNLVDRIDSQSRGLHYQVTADNKWPLEISAAVPTMLIASATPAIYANTTEQLPMGGKTSDDGALKSGQFKVGSTLLSLGGFVDASLVSRSRNLTSDIGTAFASVPFSAQGDLGRNPEFRGSARASRISLKTENEDPLAGIRLSSYVEADFLGAGSDGANQQQLNGYQIRLRQAWLAADDTDANGFHFLAGQAYSLVTPGRGKGIYVLQENLPPVIDDQTLVGNDFARQWQLRLVREIETMAIGISLENPQTIWGNAIKPNDFTRFVTTAPPDSSLGTTPVSIDTEPDLVVKLSLDSDFGHFETFALRREFVLDAGPDGGTRSTTAQALGLSAMIPLNDSFNFSVSTSQGDGLGRYGASQLPDATSNRFGKPIAIPATHALLGVIYQPSPKWLIYFYSGYEKASSAGTGTDDGQLFGYGNNARLNNGCTGTVNALEAGTTFCDGDTQLVKEITIGGWWNIYRGTAGSLQFGLQWANLRRTLFADVNKTAPTTEEQMFFASFRYSPFKIE